MVDCRLQPCLRSGGRRSIVCMTHLRPSPAGPMNNRQHRRSHRTCRVLSGLILVRYPPSPHYHGATMMGLHRVLSTCFGAPHPLGRGLAIEQLPQGTGAASNVLLRPWSSNYWPTMFSWYDATRNYPTTDTYSWSECRKVKPSARCSRWVAESSGWCYGAGVSFTARKSPTKCSFYIRSRCK